MKAKMKKGRLYAAFAAALLVTAAVILSCPNPESSGGKAEYQPPKGMGAVKLSFYNTTRTARSIVPGTTLSSFVKFDIQFEAAGSGAVPDVSNTDIAPANVAGPYNLYPGKYDITVVGYTAEGEAAVGTADGVSIAPNTITNVPKIWLEAYDPVDTGTTGDGTFAWNIENLVTGTLTTASMTFTKIVGGGTGSVPSSVDLLTMGNLISSTAIPAGYYYVDFVLEKEESPTTLTLRHILHIYQNMTSSFSYTFTDDYFIWAKVKLLDVDFKALADPKPVLEKTGSIAVNEGDPVTVSFSAAGGNPATIAITVTNASDYDTIEWFYNSDTALTGSMLSVGDSVLTINPNVAGPFTVQGTYHLTVVGTTTAPDSVPGSTQIYIKIIP